MTDEDDDLPMVPCPYCRAEIVEDAERCPHCENYISAEDAPPEPRSWFVRAMMVVALLIVAFWLARGM